MIRYKVEFDDIVAFNQHYVSTSPLFRANRRKSAITIAVMLGLLSVLRALADHSIIPLIVGFIIAAGISVWIYTRSGKIVPKRVLALYPPDQNKLVLCEHEADVIFDGLVNKSALSEHKILFAGILRVDDTPAHLFIFIGSNQALIIPKARILAGDLEDFTRRLISNLPEKLP